MDRAVGLFGQLLRLRLVVLGNGFRTPLAAVTRGVGALALVAAAVAATIELVAIGGESEWRLRAASVVIGTLVSAACLFLPAAVVRDEPLHARGFAGYGLPAPLVAALVPLTDLVSLPCLLLVVLLIGYVGAWTAITGVGGIALAAALILLVLGLQSVRLSAIVGARLWRAPRGPLGRAVAWAALLAVLALCVSPLVGDPAGAATRLLALADTLRFTGIGLIWNAPHLQLVGGPAGYALLGGLVAIIALALIQYLLVRSELRGGRPPRRRSGLDHLGAFRFVAASPTAAIAARSLVYWTRDPRYSASIAALPFAPVLMIFAASIGGVPGQVIGLVPVPVVVLLLAWSAAHNDTAHDSTAIWAHVVAPIRGIQDRIGRAIPVLALGVVIIAVGTPLTAVAIRRPGTALVVLGLSAAALLGSLGIGAVVSAAVPYAVAPPGSGAFTAPQTASSAGGAAQTISMAAVLLVTAPTAWASAMWLIEGAGWAWVALGFGVGAGLLVLVVGLLVGGRVFDRRAPELLDFAMRN